MTANDRPNGDLIRQIAKRSHIAIAIVDRDCRVLYDTLRSATDYGDLCVGPNLEPTLKRVVSRLIDLLESSDVEESVTPTALFGNSSIVRVFPARDAKAPYSLLCEAFVVSIEMMRNRDELADASRRFELTQRESEILSYLMHGAKANEIAQSLGLAEGTVQNYYKRLLAKTNSRNRASMVAAVLGWKRSAMNRSSGI